MTISNEAVEDAADGPLYYAKGREVWKRPVKTRTQNGHSVALGFRVCSCGDEIGEGGAATVAQLLSMAETFQTRTDSNEPMGCPLPGACACPAAPYMLSAPEGVSEAEIVRHMTHEEWRGCRIENYRWKFKIPEALQGSEWDWSYASHWSTPAAHEEAEALVSVKDAERALLSALSSERERAADYKQAFETADRLLGNAQARADQAEFLLALALECARTKAAREAAMFDLADAAEARAQAAERERDEARWGERNLSEHARKVAHEANKAFGVVEDMEEFWDACGHPSNRGHLTPAEQVSSIIRERDAAEARAQAALNTQHIPQGDRHD